jgi:hypothetical protein
MTTHFHLRSRLRINGAITQLPYSLLRLPNIHRKNDTHLKVWFNFTPSTLSPILPRPLTSFITVIFLFPYIIRSWYLNHTLLCPYFLLLSLHTKSLSPSCFRPYPTTEYTVKIYSPLIRWLLGATGRIIPQTCMEHDL